MAVPKRIVLGSGTLHVVQFTGASQIADAAAVMALCTNDNILGYISGGASLAYTPTFYTATDDLGYVTKTIITEEEVTLTSGIMTFNGQTLATLSATGRVTEDPTGHTRTVRIGGIGNASNTQYAIIFHHSDETDGDIYVCIVGNNQAGFTLAFAKDQETVIDAEFRALAQDDDGTLVMYIEQDATIAAATYEITSDITYVASEDTTVQSGTTYYTRTGSGTVNYPYVFTEVTNPTGNPSTQGYYVEQA